MAVSTTRASRMLDRNARQVAIDHDEVRQRAGGEHASLSSNDAKAPPRVYARKASSTVIFCSGNPSARVTVVDRARVTAA